MGLFDRFKKKEPDYDPLNMQVTDLDVGFLFDYDLYTWEVIEAYEYDWGDNFFTREFKVRSSEDTLYLHVEKDDDLVLTLNKKIRLSAIDPELPEKIAHDDRPPARIEYQGATYTRESESPGYFRVVGKKTDDWQEFIAWDYYDADGKQVVNIEQWGEREFEASAGRMIRPIDISNITPAEIK